MLAGSEGMLLVLGRCCGFAGFRKGKRMSGRRNAGLRVVALKTLGKGGNKDEVASWRFKFKIGVQSRLEEVTLGRSLKWCVSVGSARKQSHPGFSPRGGAPEELEARPSQSWRSVETCGPQGQVAAGRCPSPGLEEPRGLPGATVPGHSPCHYRHCHRHLRCHLRYPCFLGPPPEWLPVPPLPRT